MTLEHARGDMVATLSDATAGRRSCNGAQARAARKAVELHREARVGRPGEHGGLVASVMEVAEAFGVAVTALCLAQADGRRRARCRSGDATSRVPFLVAFEHWLDASSIASLPRMTRPGFSSSTTPFSTLATPSGSVCSSALTRMSRSAPVANAVGSASCASILPIRPDDDLFRLAVSFSRIASSGDVRHLDVGKLDAHAIRLNADLRVAGYASQGRAPSFTTIWPRITVRVF